MSMDVGSQESTVEETPEPVEAPEQVEAPEGHSEQQESQANPFWGEVEKLTGPNVYKLIQPHLAKADTEARTRISDLNQKFAPWKAFADRGVQPQHVEQALGVVQQLNTSPEQVYESLRGFLEREGRLPSNEELAQEVVEDEANESEDPRDAQLRQLQDNQAKLMEFLQGQASAQEQQRVQQEADAWADGEWKRIASANPNLTKEDFADIAQILAAQTNQGQAPDLDAAVSYFNAMRDRIRQTPRPGQLAPRLPSGPGGGTPASGQVDPKAMTKQQRIELASQMLQRGKA